MFGCLGRYVAREYAWLSPEREDLFSPASSVLTVRLLPCLFMKWKTDDYVRCSIDITDAFLMVDLRELTQVACEDAGGNVSHYILGKVLPGQRLDLKCGMKVSVPSCVRI